MVCVLTGFVPLNPPGRAVKCGDRSRVCRQLRKAARISPGFRRSELPILRGSPVGKTRSIPLRAPSGTSAFAHPFFFDPAFFRRNFTFPPSPFFGPEAAKSAEFVLLSYHRIPRLSSVSEYRKYAFRAVFRAFSYLYMAWPPFRPRSSRKRGCFPSFSFGRKGMKIALLRVDFRRFLCFSGAFFAVFPLLFPCFLFPGRRLRIVSRPSFFVYNLQFFTRNFYVCENSTNFFTF